MRVDLGRQLKFPEEIVVTSLRPDIVLWSQATMQVALIELTVPWEERIEEAHERKLGKYQSSSLRANGGVGVPGIYRWRWVAGGSRDSHFGEHWGCLELEGQPARTW